VISLPYFKDDRSREGNKTRQGETSLLSLRSSKHPFSEIGEVSCECRILIPIQEFESVDFVIHYNFSSKNLLYIYKNTKNIIKTLFIIPYKKMFNIYMLLYTQKN